MAPRVLMRQAELNAQMGKEIKMDEFGHEYLNELDSLIHNYHCAISEAKKTAVKEWAIMAYTNAEWCPEFIEIISDAHKINIDEVCQHTGASFPDMLL